MRLDDACEEKFHFKAKWGTLVYGEDCDFFSVKVDFSCF
jgi:hypothetical protein